MTLGAQQFLKETPRAAYMSFLPELTRPMQRHFGRNYQDIYGQYLGAIGQEAQMGQLPQLQFTDFLKNYGFEQQYGGLSPQQRGSYPSRLAPRTRFLTGY